MDGARKIDSDGGNSHSKGQIIYVLTYLGILDFKPSMWVLIHI